MLEIPQLEGVPDPVGPYSQVALVSPGARVALLAGQVAVDRDGTLVGPGDFRVQCRQVLSNLRDVLAACGSSFDRVAYLRGYVVNAADLPVFGEERVRFFDEMGLRVRPPATTILVPGLYRPEYLVEIEAVAVVPDAT